MTSEDEEILVIRRERLEIAAGWHTGFIPTISREFISALHDHFEFAPRESAEYNESLKQIIPYIVIRQVGLTNRYFVYQRLSGSGEQRLMGSYSVGIGGHLSRHDVRTELDSTRAAVVRGLDLSSLDDVLIDCGIRPLDSPLRRGLVREIAEEMILPSRSVLFPAGIINDESNSVGRVHLALVYVIEIATGNVQIRVKAGSELQGGLYTLDQLARRPGKMESWTQMLLDQGLDSL